MNTILVPVDFNPPAAAALRHAAELARGSGAGLVILYADLFEAPAEFTSGQTGDVAHALADARRRTAEALETWSQAIVPAGVPFRTTVREGYPVPAIVEAAEEIDADTIVMGSHGHGAIGRLLVGSVAAGVKKQTTRNMVTVSG